MSVSAPGRGALSRIGLCREGFDQWPPWLLLGVRALARHLTGVGLCQSPRRKASAAAAVGAEDGLESCDVTKCRSGSLTRHGHIHIAEMCSVLSFSPPSSPHCVPSPHRPSWGPRSPTSHPAPPWAGTQSRLLGSTGESRGLGDAGGPTSAPVSHPGGRPAGVCPAVPREALSTSVRLGVPVTAPSCRACGWPLSQQSPRGHWAQLLVEKVLPPLCQLPELQTMALSRSTKYLPLN